MSTTHAILDVLTTSYDQLTDNNLTCVILLDFQKAFDTVSHTSLLSKLEHYGTGIRGFAHKLMSSFFIWKTTISRPSRYAIRNSHQSIWSAPRQ